MQAVAERLEFAPPPQPGRVRALVLAVLAHLLLMIALTWGINWNRESENVAAEAELWSSVPQQAAPRAVEAPPPAAPPPSPPQPPAPRVTPAPAPAPALREADIAQEREKIRQEQALRKQQELERQKKLEARKKQQEEARREQLAERKAAEERRKKEEQARTAKARKQQQDDEKRLASLRDEQIRRIQGLAGATGSPTATGAAQRSAGPSDSYAGRIRARVKPNIVFTEDISGNPTAEVEVQMAPDGTITNRRLIKSSGARSWDEAVLRALDKTEILPRDVDGRVHSPLIIEFRPKG